MKRVRTVLGLTAVLVVLGSTYVFASGQKQAPESSAAGSTEINLTYWGWGPHVDAVNNEIGPAFTKMHPNVHITATSFGPFDLMDKFYVSIATGKGAPDVAILVRRLAGKYMIPTLLYDFTSFVEKYKSDFPPALLGDVTSVDGKILSIPPDYGPGVLFYDKSLADKLGIDVSKIKTAQFRTWRILGLESMATLRRFGRRQHFQQGQQGHQE